MVIEKDGTPQGSVIRPVNLLNVMVNDLFQGVGTGAVSSLFADDEEFWKQGKERGEILGLFWKRCRQC